MEEVDGLMEPQAGIDREGRYSKRLMLRLDTDDQLFSIGFESPGLLFQICEDCCIQNWIDGCELLMSTDDRGLHQRSSQRDCMSTVQGDSPSQGVFGHAESLQPCIHVKVEKHEVNTHTHIPSGIEVSPLLEWLIRSLKLLGEGLASVMDMLRGLGVCRSAKEWWCGVGISSVSPNATLAALMDSLLISTPFPLAVCRPGNGWQCAGLDSVSPKAALAALMESLLISTLFPAAVCRPRNG